MPNSDARLAAQELARRLLGEALEFPLGAKTSERAEARAGGVRVVVTVRVVAGGPGAATPCEADVLTALASATGPWTTTRLLAEMGRLGMEHGESTVKRALARLVRAGVVLSSRVAPRGYALADSARRAS